MDSDCSKNRKTNPRLHSSFLSKITFWYTLPFFVKTLKRELEEEDLYEVLPDYKAQTLGSQIEDEWDKLKLKKQYVVLLVFLRMIGKYYLLLGLTKIIPIVISVFRPIVTGKFVSYFVPGQTELTKADACIYSAILILLNFGDAFYRQNYFAMAESCAIKFRTAVSSLIYRKSLNLRVRHSHDILFGKIANFMTRDVNSFDFFFFFFNELWVGFVVIAICCYNMYQKIGLAVLVVVSAFAVFILCLVFLGDKIEKFRAISCAKTDERIHTFREVLCQIRSTKMYVWEKCAENVVSEARRKEMNIMFKMCVVLFGVYATAWLMYQMSYYFLLLTCIWMGLELSADNMYFVTSAFQGISFYFLAGIPSAVFSASQLKAALNRFKEIVESLDMQKKEVEDRECESNEPKIEAKKMTLVIDDKTVLKDINFVLGKGLTLLLGHASSGKSCLFMAILHEFEVDDDSLVTEGRVSYVSQEPWLFPSTIKQNILFGSEYNQKRYQEVVKLCALDYDLQMLENGDDTIVADQGINLSKGQQSRICLARAIYRESDIYLLDDCLSNLDPLVASLIFNNCILKHLQDKLVVLVSSNLSLSSYAKNVIKLSNGNVEFTKNESPKQVENFMFDIFSTEFVNLDELETQNDYATINTELISQKISVENIYGENKKSGSVSPATYKTYVELGGGKCFVFLIFCIYTLGQVSLGYKDKLVSDWTDLEERILNATDHQNLKEERNFILYTYTAVTAVLVSVIMLKGYYLYLFTKKASINLHKRMLKSVLNATIKFFDRTFMGNIVNRFSKDLVTLDENLPFIIFHLTSITFESVGNIILISFVNVKFLIPTGVLLVCLILLRHFYLKTGRALKRLEASTKAPVIGYLNATLKGLPTIKTFHAENILKSEFDKHLDLYSSATYSNKFCMYAFVWAGDNIGTFFTAFIILKFLIFSEGATAGDVGLAVSQASVMCGILYYGIAKWADLETQMTSAERAFEYTEIQQETKTGRVLKEWPKSGRIKFENVYLSLSHSKSHVLKNLSFVVNSGEKIAIVGRTGAGKSSIISSIFRLYEVEGDITIDGINIKTLSLDFLRSNISVIPQDPLLFQGTVRYNIDPERKYTDEEIWKVLENAKLKHFFRSLDTKIADTGVTFAQKQLICLARVLLKENKILLLDEITENGDSETESLIYDIVHKNFASNTVIKITHKMKYAVTCDKVLVMDKGEVVEYESPQNLLKDKNSYFHKMVERSGLKKELD